MTLTRSWWALRRAQIQAFSLKKLVCKSWTPWSALQKKWRGERTPGTCTRADACACANEPQLLHSPSVPDGSDSRNLRARFDSLVRVSRQRHCLGAWETCGQDTGTRSSWSRFPHDEMDTALNSELAGATTNSDGKRRAVADRKLCEASPEQTVAVGGCTNTTR